MALKLLYITKDPRVALIAEAAGVDRIMIDMEYIGKYDRQGGMDTVQNRHTIEDIRKLRKVLTKAQLMVRVNPIHDAGKYLGIPHSSSEEEINAVLEAGADVVMLPYFKSAAEVEKFIGITNGRAIVDPLLETIDAVQELEQILKLKGLDELHIGLNDLNLSMGGTFLFNLFSNGMVEKIAGQCRLAGIPFGIGGIAGLGGGMLPAEYIIGEHYSVGSTAAILSRSFCNTSVITEYDEIEKTFRSGLEAIRKLEKNLEQKKAENDIQFFKENKEELDKRTAMITKIIQSKKQS